MFVLVTLSPNLLFSIILYPQGSVLGPQWFTVYTSPVHDIILKYNLNYHVYADYFQIFSRTCQFVYDNAGEMYSRDS